MTPKQQARLEYERQFPNGDFDADEDAQLHISQEDYYIMWRPVEPDWGIEKMLDLSCYSKFGNCAFIWAVAGDWKKATIAALSVTPVEFYAYERRGKPRFRCIADLIRDPVKIR